MEGLHVIHSTLCPGDSMEVIDTGLDFIFKVAGKNDDGSYDVVLAALTVYEARGLRDYLDAMIATRRNSNA